MKKISAKAKAEKSVRDFIKDIQFLSSLPVARKYAALVVNEYPFDAQLLSASRLYRQSRTHYFAIDGKFIPRVSSIMRSLSAQDLFKNEIDFTPAQSEILWFKDHAGEVADQSAQVKALKQFNENSLFHEQNHRIIWQLLPPAPKDRLAFRRYLNFAESLVVTLDLALGDELGAKNSLYFERLNLVFRSARSDRQPKLTKREYRQYLLALTCATYCALELIHHADVLKAVNYVLPGQKIVNQHAVRRGLELSELFTLNTNPQWQNLFWQSSQKKLAKLHDQRHEQALIVAADPLDLNFEFALARSIFYYFGL
ncbi:MAG: hypothetical protein H7061_11800 [Bdellovibrionaceae bacterium]|nr:hypothetical protein [Bdellovibrio sp.]